MAIEPDLIDARGLKCPLPVLKLEKWLGNAPAGARVVVLATDPMARVDIPLHCRQNGHDCDLDSPDSETLRFSVTRSG